MVKHILADGRKVDSIEGMVVPVTGQTAVVYHIAADFYKNHPEIIHRKKEDRADATA